MDDLISRQEAIDAVENIDCSDGVGISALKCEAVDDGVTAIKALPSAQPKKRTEERTETHACDLISRQATIDVLDRNCILGQGLLNDTLDHIADVIMALPSAQPEIVRCKDCKWFHDIGCAIRIVDDSDKPSENDYCSFAERRTDA